MSKFIHKKSKIDLEKEKSLFEYADQVRMRIPTSCGRVWDCHECIVEIIEGENNLSEITNEEKFLSLEFKLLSKLTYLSFEWGPLICSHNPIHCHTKKKFLHVYCQSP